MSAIDDEFRLKDPNASVLLIRQEGEGNTFRVMCFAPDLPHQFDVFGQMKPADADGECSVIQRCLEHLGQCALKTRPAKTDVLANKNSPLWKLTVTWEG